jgi:hypothetical protein
LHMHRVGGICRLQLSPFQQRRTCTPGQKRPSFLCGIGTGSDVKAHPTGGFAGTTPTRETAGGAARLNPASVTMRHFSLLVRRIRQTKEGSTITTAALGRSPG